MAKRAPKLPPAFKSAIAAFLGHPGDVQAVKVILRNSAMARISELLELHGKAEWRLRPRTFAILWMLGCPEVIEEFVEENLTDHFLPYNHGNLPKAIRGSDLRARFLALQKHVLAPENLASLEVRGSPHIQLAVVDKTNEQFAKQQVLGSGAFGVVEKVWSKTSLEEFALKRIHRGNSHIKDRDAVNAFLNEIKALRTLDHRHLVDLVSTYSDPTWFGLIMTPVCDMDLGAYLGSAEKSTERKVCLRAFYGCLANALRYLHENKVRHKDIKPKNILVKGTDIYFTDFGTARRWEGDGESSTSGMIHAQTAKYCAPEVGDYCRRGRASDIWSLGCVFLEMSTVLSGETIASLKDFLNAHGDQHQHYWKNRIGVSTWIQHLKCSFESSEDVITLQWIEWMLKTRPKDRPDSHQLLNKIIEYQGETTFIGSCCLSEYGDLSPKTYILNGLQSSDLGTGEKTLSSGASHHEDRNHSGIPQSCLKAAADVTDHQSQQKRKLKNVRFSGPGTTHKPSNPSGGTEKRFDRLEPDRRPEATTEQAEDYCENFEEDLLNLEEPKPLQQPNVDSRPFVMPASTFVPSYILACSNRFSRHEITDQESKKGRVNLFVYGRFMFPNVLRNVAARSTEGAYSQTHRRRLFPTTDDWAKVNLSLKHAAEAMTPGVLDGYDRWKPQGIDCAAIQDSRQSKAVVGEIERSGYPAPAEPNGKVHGFLIRGLTKEALRYCDLLLMHDRATVKRLRTPKDDNKEAEENIPSDPSPTELLMKRRKVLVEIRFKTGESTTVPAHTYVWKQDIYGLCAAWDPGRFIQSPGLRSLSQGAHDWTSEERELADIMRTDYVLPGDVLCSHVLRNEPQIIKSLLSQTKVDPDAPCRIFGTALQAAASLGDELVVHTLLDHGADASSRGGRYGSPVMAAAVSSRKAVLKTLIKNRADIFCHGGRFVSPLYQAVGHSDWAIAQLLLDNGAWLGEGYAEVLDLAAERRDPDMKMLLVDYDVQNLYQQLTAYESFCPTLAVTRARSGRSEADKTVGSVVLREVWALSGMSGRWKGIKGVQVTRAALEAGAPPETLVQLRKAWNPVLELLSILQSKAKEKIKRKFRIPGGDSPSEYTSFEWSYEGQTPTMTENSTKSGTHSETRDGRERGERKKRTSPQRTPTYRETSSTKSGLEETKQEYSKQYRDSPPPYPGTRRQQ